MPSDFRTTKLRKVLVANRGEIAVRVIRACQELGIRSVAVFSEADEAALHVQMADEAAFVGRAPSTESYLVIDRIIEAAVRHGADAVHPGYGFLSERADFAEACAAAGLIFIGPPAGAMRLLGDKVRARELAIEAGVPVVPGSKGAVAGLAEAKSVASEIGYPLIIKAAAGGGGKGMRLVRTPGELAASYKLAGSEAAGAFGDCTIYMERYIERPRHVEIQVLADVQGNAVHLGERECSVQRRHQKLVEETPSPAVDEELRRRLGEAAVRITLACGYVNAGTVEFMVDEGGGFYFLEVNTRLQVEHPITEMVTGIDLVHRQLAVASGRPLGLRQEEIGRRGAAIECRIYAEDADGGFVPSPGRISYLLWPGGPGVRVDSGIYAGYDVPLHYDPLLAKLCAWAPTRPEAIARMRRALRELRIGGITTTATFLDRVLAHQDFAGGRYNTHFLDDRKEELLKGSVFDPGIVAALGSELVCADAQEHKGSSVPGISDWRRIGRAWNLVRRA